MFQGSSNRINVRREAICGDLKVSRCGRVQFLNEDCCIERRTASKVPSQHELAVALDSNERVGVALLRVALDVVLLLAADEAPNLVGLDIGHGQAIDAALKKALTLGADDREQVQNCGVVDAGDALDRANGASLAEKLDSLGRILDAGIHRAEWRRVIFGEGLAALLAAITLKSVAVPTEFLAARLAVVTGHIGLLFLRSKPI